ncbi:hypothetical protein ACFL2D_01385 [Patescibacteria group bacterium]
MTRITKDQAVTLLQVTSDKLEKANGELEVANAMRKRLELENERLNRENWQFRKEIQKLKSTLGIKGKVPGK